MFTKRFDNDMRQLSVVYDRKKVPVMTSSRSAIGLFTFWVWQRGRVRSLEHVVAEAWLI